jgi:hypothetical protein
MRNTDKAKSDRVEGSLRDDELNAATGAIGGAIVNWSTEGNREPAGIQPLRSYSIGFGHSHRVSQQRTTKPDS